MEEKSQCASKHLRVPHPSVTPDTQQNYVFLFCSSWIKAVEKNEREVKWTIPKILHNQDVILLKLNPLTSNNFLFDFLQFFPHLLQNLLQIKKNNGDLVIIWILEVFKCTKFTIKTISFPSFSIRKLVGTINKVLVKRWRQLNKSFSDLPFSWSKVLLIFYWGLFKMCNN